MWKMLGNGCSVEIRCLVGWACDADCAQVIFYDSEGRMIDENGERLPSSDEGLDLDEQAEEDRRWNTARKSIKKKKQSEQGRRTV